MDGDGWREVATRQHGVISRCQLQDHGLPPSAITRMVDGNQLWPVVQGHFLVGGAPLTYAAKRWVAVLSTGGVIGYGSAADMWGLQLTRPERVHVCVEHPVHSHAPHWLALHRGEVPGWARTRRDGLALGTKGWTLLDLIAIAPSRSAAGELMDKGLQQGWITPAVVERRLTAHPAGRVNGWLRELSMQLGTEDRTVLPRSENLGVPFEGFHLAKHPATAVAGQVVDEQDSAQVVGLV